ncbi:Gfo/Idh/MocA family oxidoreductase [Candidatus Pelagibacter sp.]|jgi:predicted dehydrogenase|nr:Gfo/Idh/MocA family oxidoreductase [Candidatus Pelagibacter sp.]|tara:strand:+ start:1499 stop:2476 length:978 start_codon:yes stop_codon:yes gene_type:complete
MIKWGIIGLGRMGNTFANAINEVENSKLISVASKSDYKLSVFQKNFNIKSVNKFKNYNELLSSNQIDAVYISTLNNTHVDLILKCAKNNKKILCEKPIGLNLNQANLALEAINKYNISFYEAIAYRAHPQTKTLLELIDSGDIGEVYKIEAYFGFKIRKIKKESRLFNKDLGGGAILDIGCYPISFFNQFCKKDEQLKLIKSKGSFSSTGVDDESEAEILIGKNIKAICKVSFKENLNNICKIHGKKGTINIPSPWLPAEKSYIEVVNKNSYYKKFTMSKNIYTTQIEAVANSFIDNSLNNKNIVNINESIEIMKILDSWRLSLK